MDEITHYLTESLKAWGLIGQRILSMLRWVSGDQRMMTKLMGV